MKKLCLSLLLVTLTTELWTHFEACTRVVYKGAESTVITARLMDWRDEIPPNILPKEQKFDSNKEKVIRVLKIKSFEIFKIELIQK